MLEYEYEIAVTQARTCKHNSGKFDESADRSETTQLFHSNYNFRYY